jgi:hypothetical protein
VGYPWPAAGYDPGVDAGPKDAPREAAPVRRVRQLCLALPEATERLSHGEPTWFVRDRKVFVTFADRHHDDRVALWCAAPPGEQQARVAAEPERYFVPPYVGGRGWLGVYLDVPVDWDEVAEIVADAYRVVAPKRLVAQLDERAGGGAAGGERRRG